MQNAPILLTGLEMFYSAFASLSTCRVQGLGVGDIPWTAISAYCDRNGIKGDQASDLFYFVRVLDAEYQKHQASKRETAGGK